MDEGRSTSTVAGARTWSARNVVAAVVFFVLLLAAAWVAVDALRASGSSPGACSPQSEEQATRAGEEFERQYVQPAGGTAPYVGFAVIREGGGFMLLITTDEGADTTDSPGCVADTPIRYVEQESQGSRG